MLHRAFLFLVPLLLLACGEPRAGSSGPGAAFTARSVVPVGETVIFDASWSIDNGLIMEYGIDFGDGSPRLIGFSSEFEHRYDVAGNYVVTLTVKDDLANEGSWSAEILVTDNYTPCRTHGDCATDSQCNNTECRLREPECFSSATCPTTRPVCVSRRCQAS